MTAAAATLHWPALAPPGFKSQLLRLEIHRPSPTGKPAGLHAYTATRGGVFGAIPVGRILLHGAAAHGRLDVVSASRNGPSPTYAAYPSPAIEKFDIRFDDPVRVHRFSARGTGAIHALSRHQKNRESVEPLRPAARPKTSTAPTLGPGYKVSAVRVSNLALAGYARIAETCY